MTTSGQRIVLAEDDRMLRKAMETVLRRHGFVVSSAVDGEEALRLIQTEQPDLVLLDLIMPKLQGFDVLASLKEDPATAAIPVIVLSNLSQDRDKQEALDHGAVGYLSKSALSLERIAKEVEVVLSKGAP